MEIKGYTLNDEKLPSAIFKDTACLCIHGYNGNLGEIEYLVQYLSNRGFDIFPVVLAGHGGNKNDLKKASPEDWINSIKSKADELKNKYQQVVFIGFSMGGLLSICCSLGEYKTSGIVLINTPINHLYDGGVIWKDIFNGKIKNYINTIFATSLKSNRDFLQVQSEANKIVSCINVPVFIVQCTEDETSHKNNARELKKLIGDSATLRYYEGGCHTVLIDDSNIREKICSDIFKYLVDIIAYNDSFASRAKLYSEIEFIKNKAEDNDTNAMYVLAAYCERGITYGKFNIQQDYEKALRFYTKAAHFGDKIAISDLADIYYHGRCGVNKDILKAKDWNINRNFDDKSITFQKQIIQQTYNQNIEYLDYLANDGDTDAMYILAIYYERGLIHTNFSMKQNEEKAISLYKKAAHLNDKLAMATMSDIYYHERCGVKKDISKAAEWNSKRNFN